jgi:hypothetical protein
MSIATGADALVALYEALSADEQSAAYETIRDRRLRKRSDEETELARHVRSERR